MPTPTHTDFADLTFYDGEDGRQGYEFERALIAQGIWNKAMKSFGLVQTKVITPPAIDGTGVLVTVSATTSVSAATSTAIADVEVGAIITANGSTTTVEVVSDALLSCASNIDLSGGKAWTYTNPAADFARQAMPGGVSSLATFASLGVSTPTMSTDVLSSVTELRDQTSARLQSLQSSMLEIKALFQTWGVLPS